MHLPINNRGQCPFVDNFLASCIDEDRNDMFSFLLFMKSELQEYRRIVTYGEIDFQEYLNRRYPPVSLDETKKSKKR